ncbi:titin homolog [Anopheles marshallii]|uniref:titin homolog n=1 Tax=Anopheles marshallii TaxID=1521116 RepID=UPI00237C2BAA|nr:titin homolog [Anopheles marshallii]
MQMQSIELVNAIASPIAKVTETLKNIDLQSAHVEPTVVLEDCLLQMCESFEKAQSEHSVEQAKESTAHSKLLETVTHVQHDIRECIQQKKDTRAKASQMQQGALESLKQSLSDVQQLIKTEIVVKDVSKPLFALESTINELVGQPMQMQSIELVNAIASPIAKVTETLKNIDLQSAHVEPTVVLEDCLLQMCESFEKAQSEHFIEQAKESTAHSKLLETVSHVQHDIRECIQQEKDTRAKASQMQQGALESLKQSLSDVQQLIKTEIVVKDVSKPLFALESTINELVGQHMQMQSIELVNAIASPIAKVTETLKNIDLQSAHVEPTVVLEDCLLQMCESFEKAQSEHSVEQAKESTAHSKLLETVTHVQHDIRECIQQKKDTRAKASQMQQGALESLKQSLSDVQQLIKTEIVVKDVSKPLFALESTINELVGQPMQMQSIELVNAIASPIAKVTETLKNIDLQSAHVEPTVVLEDCLLQMCESFEKAQSEHSVEQAKESTAHSKLLETVTHVQHDIRECIQQEKDTRAKASQMQQGALESLKQSLSDVQQLIKTEIVVKDVSKPLFALESTINELVGQPMQMQSIELVNAIASPIAKVTETLKNIDLQSAHVEPTVVLEDCLLQMCESFEKAQSEHSVEQAKESTAHSKLLETVTHVQHDIRECIQQEKDTRAKASQMQQGALESLKQSLSDVQQLIKTEIVVKDVSKPLFALESTINELVGQPMQMQSIELVNAIASPIAKVTETLKNIDLQSAHVEPTVVLEDCLLQMCESFEKAQSEHSVEQAKESTAHSKLLETVTHVQHDIRECIQQKKDTRAKASQMQQGALESLKQSLSDVQQLIKTEIVVKDVSKPLFALESTINELVGQPMQMQSIELVNAIASPIAKVTETLKNIDLQSAHVEPTVVLEDCLLQMCESFEKAQSEHSVEQAKESTAHSKLLETVTHVQHDIRECIQQEKDTRAKASQMQQGALESLKQSLSDVQQLIKTEIVVKDVSKPLFALESTINELVGQPMQMQSIELVNAIASPIAKVTETLKNIDLQSAHVEPTVVLEDCLLQMCESFEKAQSEHSVEQAKESTAHSKLLETVTHVQHDIRECIQQEKDTRAKASQMQQGALESLKQSLSDVQQLIKTEIVVKDVSKPLFALESTINELVGQPMQMQSIELVNAIASPIAKVTETLKNIDLQSAHVEPTVVLEDCLLQMCESFEKAQSEHSVEQAKESTAHSKLLETVTHVQHDIRECIQQEKDTRAKASQMQQGALESLKQSLSDVQQLIKTEIVVKDVSKPLFALESTINELVGQPMQMQSIELVNAIASPIAKVTETLKNIDLQSAHVEPTVVLEDCLLQMCESFEKAQSEHSVEQAKESTAHSKLLETVTHVQHDIRECIQQEKDTRAKASQMQQGALESLKQSLSDVQQLIKTEIVVKDVSKPLFALESTINELVDQHMQMQSIELVNAIASPIAKVIETLKNIDLQSAHVEPTVVLEDCLLQMCESFEKAQSEHSVEQAKESTAHSKLLETVTHVQHDIRECIQQEKDTRAKASQMQQGALESLKQSLSDVQQLIKTEIVVKDVSKPLFALESTINELVGQPMQMQSIELVNAIASPIAKVTETLKNIDLQSAHVEPTVVLEDCLLQMCESFEKAQSEHSVEQAKESTAHSKLLETVTHVQHDIRECIQQEKDTRAKASQMQQGALESLKQSLSDVQQLIKTEIVVKDVSKPLFALESTINELVGQPMQMQSIELVNAIASPIAKVTETLKNIDLQSAHVEPTVVLEDCLLQMCESFEKAQSEHSVEQAKESTAHSKLLETVTHVQHDIRECIQQEKDTRAKASQMQQGALESLKQSLSDVQQLIKTEIVVKDVSKPLFALESTINELVGQPMQMQSIELVNAIASPIAKVTETLKNIDLQSAHVEPTVVLEDCLLQMCESFEKAQSEHSVEQAKESTAHSKLLETVTHVQHDIRECIQQEKDTRAKASQMQQGALESLKQSLSDVQQLIKTEIVVKDVSKPLFALESTINELVGQHMQMQSIELVNAIASPIAKVTETLKNIDLQSAHVEPTVVLEDCLLQMCESFEKAQSEHSVEQAKESTAHSKLLETVTHVQHDIRECIQQEKDTRAKASQMQQGALESLKQSLSDVQQLIKTEIVVKDVSKPLFALESTINELVGQPMQMQSIELVNAIASPIAKVTETLKNIDLQSAHVEPTVVLEDCLLQMCESFEKAQSEHSVEQAKESTAHSKLLETVTHVQHDIRECIQQEKDTRAKASQMQQGALESLKQSLSDVQQLIKTEIVVKDVSKPLFALESTINELVGQPMQMQSIELVNAIASPIAKVTETLKNIDLQSAHVEPTVVLEDCLLQMCESFEKAQSEHSVEQAKESTAHSKLLETVTHVQHDIRECIQQEKDTRAKASQMQQGALESLKQSLSDVQQLIKTEIVVKDVSKPLFALESTINELVGQHMQMQSIELVNAIASPIAKVTETLKNIDLQSAHVEPTVVLEDCLLQMCESFEKAQSEHSVEQAKESTAHSKLLETVTHVQHDIRECIQQEKDTRAKASQMQQGALESLKQSLSDVQQLIKTEIVVKDVSKPLFALESTINELVGQPMQMQSIELVNAIASPIAKVTETLKNIDLQSAHVEPTVVLEDCLLQMCESFEKAQSEHSVEQAKESTAHSKLLETVTHVQHDIRECIQQEKDTRAKASQMQQGALESLKQSLSDVQQLIKTEIVVKDVSKPLFALESTINELVGQPMQMQSIELVNAIASPIAKVTETLKNIDLQSAHVEPTVVLEDCLLQMCESFEKAQSEHSVEQAKESTAHSKLLETVTHVQHDIRECIQQEKDTRAKASQMQQGALESLKQSLSDVQQLIKTEIVVKDVSKPLFALESTINELVGQPMQMQSIELVNAIASPIAKVTETLKNIDLQSAHVEPTVVLEDCLLQMCESFEKAQSEHSVEQAKESIAHSKLLETVTHVQHDIRECIQQEKDTRAKASQMQQGALESLKQSLSDVQQLIKTEIVVKDVSKPLFALESTINELVGQPMQMQSIELVNAIASPIAKVTETLKNIDLQSAHVEPTVVLEDCLLQMCESFEKAQSEHSVEQAKESTAHSKLLETVTHVQHDIRECIQQEKDTRAKASQMQQGALESLKQSLSDVQQLIKTEIVVKDVSKPLFALESTINELVGQPMQMQSIELVNAIASPIAKVTETLKNIDLQSAHVEPTVVLEDCLLQMCESFEKAQSEHSIEQAKESIAHSKLLETVTHVQHDIRECIQQEKDTRAKASQMQQGALESLKQSLSDVQQLIKTEIVVKDVSKPLFALESTINELVGQPMQMQSIELVNAIASPIAKVTETLKNIDLQSAHVEPTVVLEDCLLQMCESFEKAQSEHSVEQAKESTAHSKLLETVTHVQHEIRECIQQQKNIREIYNSDLLKTVHVEQMELNENNLMVHKHGGAKEQLLDQEVKKIAEEDAEKQTKGEEILKKQVDEEVMKYQGEMEATKKQEENKIQKKKADDESKKKLEEEETIKKKSGEEGKKRKAEEEANKIQEVEEATKKKIEEEDKKKKAEEETKMKQVKEDAKKQKQSEEEVKKKLKVEEENKKKQDEEEATKKKAEEEAKKKKAEEEAKKIQEDEQAAKEKAEEEAKKKKAEDAAKKKQEEEEAKKKKTEEEAEKKKKAEEEAKKKKAEEEAKRIQEEEEAKKKKAEDAAKKKQEEEEANKKKTEEEAKKKQDEEEVERKKKAEEEAKKKKAEEEAKKKKAEEEAKKKKAEEEAKKIQEEEKAAKEKAEEEAKKKKAEDAAKKKQEEEEAKKKKAEEEDEKIKKAEEEAKKKKAEEEAKKKKAEEDAKKIQEEEKAAKEKAEEEAKKKKTEEEAEKKKKAEEEAKKKQEEEEANKKKAEEEAKKKQDEEEAEKKKKAEEEAKKKKKAEEEAKKKQDEEEAERKKKAEEEAKKKKAEEEAKKKKAEEEAKKKKAEEEAKKIQEEEKAAKEKAEEEAKKKKAEDAAKKKQEEEEAKKKKAEEEAEKIKKAEEEAKKKKAEEEAKKKKAEEDAKKIQEEEKAAKEKAEEEAKKKKAEEEAEKKKKAEEEAKKKQEEEEANKKKAEEEAKKKQDEEEAEKKKKAEEEAKKKKKAEEEAKKKQDEEEAEKKKKAEEEAKKKKKAEEEAKKKQDEEEAERKKKAEEEAKKKKAEEEAKKKKAEEEAKKKKAEEEAKKKKAEEEAKKIQEEEKAAKEKAEEEAKKKKAEVAAKKKQEEEEAKKKKAEEEAEKKKKAEEEAKKKKAEEEAKKKKAEEEAKKKKAEEEAKKIQEEEKAAKEKAEEEAKKKKAEDAAKKKQEEEEARKKKAEEEAEKKKKAEEEAKKKKAEEEAKRIQEQEKAAEEKAEEEAKKKKAEDAAKKKQEEEEAKKKKAEEEAEKKKKAEEEAKKKKAEEEAKKKQEVEEAAKKKKKMEEAKKKMAEEEAKKRQEEEEAEKKKNAEEETKKKKAEEEAKKKKAEEEEAKQKKAEAEAKKKQEEEEAKEEEATKKKTKEDAKKKKAEEEAKKKQEEEEERIKKQKDQEEAKKKTAEEEAKKKQELEEATKKKAEEEVKKKKAEIESKEKQEEEEAKKKIEIEVSKRKAEEEAKKKQEDEVKTKKIQEEVEATMKKPSYSTCVNLLLQLTVPVHDLVKELPSGTGCTVDCVTPALKHNLRQLYRVVSLMSQQHITRIRNEREVTIVEELRRHLLSLDKVLKALLDLHSKVEMQKELLDTIRRNLITLKSVMMQVRTDYCIPSLVEKDDQLLSAFEMVVEKLTINPLQLDSVEYLRLLAESLEKYCDIMRRLSNNVTISDWLLRYQLQLLKIFDTIEFCLSEEQFIVIGSKEKYTRTSTQDAIHAVKQMITHYKITSSQQQQVRRDQASEPTHIKVIAARQGLTDTPEPVARSVQERSPRRTPDVRQQRSDTVRRHATRSPLGLRDDPPRSSSRCSLGALPSKRGPSFAVYLKNVFIEREHSFKLLCVVLDSEIDVRWTKDGSDITQTGRYRMVQKNGLITLQVDHAEYEDTGVYACHVFNNYGQSFNKCTVEVYDTSDDIICSSFSIPHKMDSRPGT